MKSFIFIIGLCLLSVVVKAEDSSPTDSVPTETATATPYIEYDYDDSGNRASRVYYGVVTMPSSRSAKVGGDDSSDVKDVKTPEIIETVLAEELSVRLFPNPTKGALHLECDGISDFGDGSYELTDINGRVLQKVSFLSPSQKIDMHHLPEGAYILLLKVENEIYRFKIIKQ